MDLPAANEITPPSDCFCILSPLGGRPATGVFRQALAVVACCGLLAFWGMNVAAQAQTPLSPAEEAYLRGYDVEQGAGEPERALAWYEKARQAAGANEAVWAARSAFRIGVCRRKLGRAAAAREIWQELLRAPPADAELASRTQAELQALQAQMERVRIAGRTIDPTGQPVSDVVVWAGDWNLDPPVLSGADGSFALDRKMAGEERDETRAAAVYAEHPRQRLAGVAMGRPADGCLTGLSVRLEPMSAVTGAVLDSAGQPVAGAQVALDAFLPGAGVFVIPLNRLVPAAMTDAQGRFRFPAIAGGLRVRLTPAKEGYVLRSAAEVVTAGATVQAPPLFVEAAGPNVVTGTVTDERGVPLAARVTARSLPPEARELAAARTEADGRYRLAGLPEARVVIRADPLAPRYAWRAVTGIPVGRAQQVDFVLSAQAPVAAEAKIGEPAPALAAQSVNTAPLALASAAGDAVVIAFWSRAALPEPPAALAAWQRAYGPLGLRVWCLHDHSGYPEDLLALAAARAIPYALAIDAYALAADERAANSLTRARYGLAAGQAALVDRLGRLVMTGDITRSATAGAMEEELRRLVRGAAPAGPAAGGAPEAAPPWEAARWLRGDPQSGAPVEPADVRGQIVIVRFGSIYLDAQMRNRFPGETPTIEHILRLLGARGVTAVWVLPAAESGPDAERLVLQNAAEIPVAVDRDGRTYRAYAVGAEIENCILDRQGRVHRVHCPDAQLFRAVKDLLAEESE
jgi:hypothetical protein